jgi:hypothetical protein
MPYEYQKRPNYMSGLSGAESCGPDQQWDPNYKFGTLTGQCTPKGSAMTPAPSSGGIGGVLQTIGSALVNSFTGAQKAQGQSAAYQQYLAANSGGGTPSWVVPAAIGGAGLVLALVLLKRK